MGLHVICERDVGLFSLVQQVVAHVRWARCEGRVPVVLFGDKTCYWTPQGYAGRDTVWEYYFRPVVDGYPASRVPEHVRRLIGENHPSPSQVGYRVHDTFVSSHFGDHPLLAGKALAIPYLWDDPDDVIRRQAGDIIRDFVRPRSYINAKTDQFFDDHMAGRFVIGVHARGTDATSEAERRPHRQDSLVLPRYLPVIQHLLEGHPGAKIFVATDDESSLRFFQDAFGEAVCHYASIRHSEGQASATGPTGWIMPAFVARDRRVAARQGEEAVVDYLLLSRCDYLVHNGSGLARTALLTSPRLQHTNTHTQGQPAPPVAAGVIQRVRSQKARRQTVGLSYQDRPSVAFVVHSFNRRSNVEELAAGIRRMGNHELIVCDDGSVDGSREAWAKLLDRPNDFLIGSNDLHEIRILDRAVRFARGDIVCLVQDDDRIPDDREWLDQALDLFAGNPALAVVGGFMGFPALGRGTVPFWGPAPFCYVHHVNIGPYLVWRSHYETLGGWDLGFSAVGEPGICFDSELCLRAWLGGFEVGYSFVPFKGPPGQYNLDGGTVLFSGSTRLCNKFRNEEWMFEHYGRDSARLDRLVAAANQRHLNSAAAF